MEITDIEFSRIVRFMKNKYGINLTEKKVLITGRLENYLLRNNYENYSAFLDKVEGGLGFEEERALVDILTTNHTYFLREPVHFNFLRNVVLPELRETEHRARDIRIWSAAASSGEEPYTIAMVLRDFFGSEAPLWNTKLLATDISKNVLEKALKGEYADSNIEKLPAHWQKAYFEKTDVPGTVRVTKNIRDEVIFRLFNLLDVFPFKRQFHVIFLRNVMIYFSDDVKQKVIDKMYDALEPGGYLFIGTTETIDRESTKLTYVQPSIYCKGREQS